MFIARVWSCFKLVSRAHIWPLFRTNLPERAAEERGDKEAGHAVNIA